MLLRTIDISVHYEKALAVDRVSIDVSHGDLLAILGSNGAGKSTLLKALTGLHPISSGEICFLEKRIDEMKIHEIVKLGLIHIPEGRRLFPELTVFSNLRLGAYLRKDRGSISTDMDMVFQHFPRLKERGAQKAGTLSGGEQQMLAIGRALMGKPKLLLMDEPSLGLAPIIVDELAPVIKSINAAGVGIILVEQNVPLALKVADRGYVIQLGRIILKGTTEVLKQSDVLKRAYLG